MGVWYGSVHTLAIVSQSNLTIQTLSADVERQATTYALIDLYSHPEYVEPLRKEGLSTALHGSHFTHEALPLLDSFLRESARLSAFESSKRRRCEPQALLNLY